MRHSVTAPTGPSRGAATDGAPPAGDERRIAALARRSRSLTGLLDAEGNVVYLSPDALEYFTGHRDSDEFVGPGRADRIHPDDFAAVAEAFAASLDRPGDPVAFRARTLHDDGTYRHFEGTLVNLLDDPDVAGVALTVVDLTSQVAAEEALRASEERLRRLVHNSPDAVLVLAADGTVTYASSVVHTLLGYDVEAQLGMSALALIHPDDLPAAVERMAFLMEHEIEEHDPLALRVQHADGTWIPVEVTAANLLDDPVLRGIVVNLRDMRERTRIAATLREAEVRFEQAFRHAPIGMGLGSTEGTLLKVNPALCEMLGYEEHELVGRDFGELSHPDDEAGDRRVYADLFAGARRDSTVQMRFRRKDGRYLWTSVSASVVRDDDGNPLYSIGHIEDITERRRLEAQLEHDATHDALTGLPGRKRLLEDLGRALEHARRDASGVAVLFIDLDHFKRVNDGLGHAAGDALLAEVARRLEAGVRSVDTASRFGGDEFVVVCPQVVSARDAVRVAERIQHRLEMPFDVSGVEVSVSCSIGIAVGEGALDAETMLRNADTAAYRAKERGRNRWEIFDDELRASVAQRLDTEAALRRALERDELRVLYQPIVRLDSGAVCGVEAFVRWERPGHGLLAPAAFLAVAEETGLVVDIDRTVLRAACEQLAAWASTIGHIPSPLLSVNVSARHLLQPEFVAEVAGTLEATGVPADRLCLELTETLLLQDPDWAMHTLHELEQLGVQFAIDDFGTGYSSLRHLCRLPVAHVKLDRTFVAELGDRTGTQVAASVIGLARALDMQVVAEGVERADQVERLGELGCELAQGYYFSRPVPAVRMSSLLAAGAVSPASPERGRAGTG